MNISTSFNPWFLILVGSFVAGACAYVGSLMVLKRMSLVGDALSHVALPGMALAISIGVSPILGAFTALTLAIIGIWYLEETSDTYPEALVGIFFTASLALGLLLTNESDLLEALFGSLEKLSLAEGLMTMAISVLAIIVATFLYDKVIISIISPELAKVNRINVKLVNLVYLLLVGTIVSLGIRFVGTLLMGALVIVPAVSARNVTRTIAGYLLVSAFFGVISAAAGIFMASRMSLPVGAMVVLASVTIYILSYFLKLQAK